MVRRRRAKLSVPLDKKSEKDKALQDGSQGGSKGKNRGSKEHLGEDKHGSLVSWLTRTSRSLRDSFGSLSSPGSRSSSRESVRSAEGDESNSLLNASRSCPALSSECVSDIRRHSLATLGPHEAPTGGLQDSANDLSGDNDLRQDSNKAAARKAGELEGQNKPCKLRIPKVHIEQHLEGGMDSLSVSGRRAKCSEWAGPARDNEIRYIRRGRSLDITSEDCYVPVLDLATSPDVYFNRTKSGRFSPCQPIVDSSDVF